MKINRSITILLICVLMLSLGGTSAIAEEYDATLDIEYEINDSDNIVIVATLNNIKAKNGLIGCEYDITYDTSALRIKSFEANIPDSWKPLDDKTEESPIQNITLEKKPGQIYWTVITPEVNIGVKDNDQFFITLVFEKLNNSKTTVSFDGVAYSEYVTIVGNKPSYNPYEIKVNNAKIEIDLNTPDKPNIDTSIPNSIEFPLPESFDEVISGTISDGPIRIPNVGGNNNGPFLSDGAEFESGDDLSSGQSSSTVIIWVLLSILGVVGVFAAVYVMVVSKRKG